MSTIISKCVSAVEKDDLSGLTRDDFGAALEQLATKFAVDNQDLTHEAAYALCLKSETGKILYQGYDSCPATVEKQKITPSQLGDADEVESSEQESESENTAPPTDAEVWAKIEAEARKIIKASNYKLSMAKATQQVLKDQPKLYEAYETARRKRQIASGSH